MGQAREPASSPGLQTYHQSAGESYVKINAPLADFEVDHGLRPIHAVANANDGNNSCDLDAFPVRNCLHTLQVNAARLVLRFISVVRAQRSRTKLAPRSRHP